MPGTGFDVVVHFSEPVPGIHPIDGGPFRADRHVFRAHHLWQDAADTRLITADDVTVAQWPTDLVDRVVWKPLAVSVADAASHPARPAAAAPSNPVAAIPAVADHIAATHAPSSNGAAVAGTSRTGDPHVADVGDWIQPMTLKTSQDVVGAASGGSPHPNS